MIGADIVDAHGLFIKHGLQHRVAVLANKEYARARARSSHQFADPLLTVSIVLADYDIEDETHGHVAKVIEELRFESGGILDVGDLCREHNIGAA